MLDYVPSRVESPTGVDSTERQDSRDHGRRGTDRPKRHGRRRWSTAQSRFTFAKLHHPLVASFNRPVGLRRSLKSDSIPHAACLLDDNQRRDLATWLSQKRIDRRHLRWRRSQACVRQYAANQFQREKIRRTTPTRRVECDRDEFWLYDRYELDEFDELDELDELDE